MKKSTLTRREFVGAAGAAVAACTIVPRHAVAGSGQTPPSEKLNIAGIGVGGMRIIPEEKMKAYKLPEKKIPRTSGHHQDWLQAIRNGTQAGSDFAAYGGPLTEVAMLGVIAIKLPGTKLEWDAEHVQFTNCPEANQFVHPPYRAGWTL